MSKKDFINEDMMNNIQSMNLEQARLMVSINPNGDYRVPGGESGRKVKGKEWLNWMEEIFVKRFTLPYSQGGPRVGYFCPDENGTYGASSFFIGMPSLTIPKTTIIFTSNMSGPKSRREGFPDTLSAAEEEFAKNKVDLIREIDLYTGMNELTNAADHAKKVVAIRDKLMSIFKEEEVMSLDNLLLFKLGDVADTYLKLMDDHEKLLEFNDRMCSWKEGKKVDSGFDAPWAAKDAREVWETLHFKKDRKEKK